MKNIYFCNFLKKILAKYSPKRTILKNFLGGACPLTPYQTHGFAPCKYPHFKKNILNPPPSKIKS